MPALLPLHPVRHTFVVQDRKFDDYSHGDCDGPSPPTIVTARRDGAWADGLGWLRINDTG